MTWRRQRSAPWPLNSLRNSSARSGSSLEVAAAPCSPPPFPMSESGCSGYRWRFGLTVLSGAYALGPISGGHFNPAVSVGLCVGGRFPAALLLPYVAAQVIGGLCGAGVLYHHREREPELQPCRRIRLQRLRRALTRRIFASVRPRMRSRDDVHVPHRSSSAPHTSARQQGSPAWRSVWGSR